jgi:hypothetical protein
MIAGAATAQTYEVTVTNLTYSQILSPPVVATHAPGYRIFRVGDEASPELAAVAEDAASDDLIALLQSESQVGEVAIGNNVILPGESQTITIDRGGRRSVSVLGMLVTTNDAFFAATSRVQGGSDTVLVPAYDAGSESNTQNCSHIPGPPCGSPGVRVTDGAEGFIHVHRGIHRRGDLAERALDWRNPVARVNIRRVDQ